MQRTAAAQLCALVVPARVEKQAVAEAQVAGLSSPAAAALTACLAAEVRTLGAGETTGSAQCPQVQREDSVFPRLSREMDTCRVLRHEPCRTGAERRFGLFGEHLRFDSSRLRLRNRYSRWNGRDRLRRFQGCR